MINLKKTIPATAAILLVVFGFNPLLKWGLEKGGAAAFGAKTEIDGFLLNPFSGNMDIRRIQVANKDAPLTNLFEVGAFRLGLSTEQMFYKRVNIERATIDNLRLGTPRKTSGALPFKKPQKPKEKFDLNKFASDMELRPEAVASAFKTTPPKAGIEAERIQKENTKRLEEVKKLLAATDIQKELDALNLAELSNISISSPEDFQKWQGVFNEKQKGLKKITDTIAANKEAVERVVKAAQVDLEYLQQVNQKDIDNLLGALNIGNYDLGAIGKELLGPKINGYLNTGTQYFALAQKYMPPKKEKAAKKPKKERFKGETIVFPNNKTRPRFWLGRLGLSGLSGEGTSNELKYSGYVTDIASEQYLIGRPTVIKINGAFTKRIQSSMDIDITLDHRRADSFRHNYNFFISGYDLSGAQFWDEQMLPLKITSGLGQIRAAVEITGEAIQGELVLQGRDMRYVKDPQASGAQALVAEAIMSAPELTVRIALAGTVSNPQLRINTNVDALIKARLEKEFGDQVAKVQAQVAAEYAKLSGTAQKDLASALNMQEAELAALLGGQQDALKGGQAILDAKKKELESQANSQVDAVKQQAEDALKKALSGLKL